MALYTMPCVLFAGGKSSRMGKDKSFLPFADAPSLVQYQYKRLKELFSRVYLSAKDEGKFNGLNAVIIEDLLYKDIAAPTVGLINTFKELKEDNSFFVLSVDTPFVDDSIFNRLLVEADSTNYDAYIVRTASGIHPLCGIYTRPLEEPLKAMASKGKHRLTRLLENSNVLYIDVEDEKLLSNLNTPAEYEKALTLLKKKT